MSNVIEVSESNVEVKVPQSSVWALVHYWESHCQPCRIFHPVLVVLAQSMRNSVKIVTGNGTASERRVND